VEILLGFGLGLPRAELALSEAAGEWLPVFLPSEDFFGTSDAAVNFTTGNWVNLLLLVVSTSMPAFTSQSAPSSQSPLRYMEKGSSLGCSTLKKVITSHSVLIIETGIPSILDLLYAKVSMKARGFVKAGSQNTGMALNGVLLLAWCFWARLFQKFSLMPSPTM
jgi:hypothetical protein